MSATTVVSSSAITTASHTPTTPINSGRMSSSTSISPNVRRKDNTADSFPFDNAVNTAEVKIFSPQNRKLNGKNQNPVLAISYTGVPFSEKKLTRGKPKTTAKPKITMETRMMNQFHPFRDVRLCCTDNLLPPTDFPFQVCRILIQNIS